MDDFPDYVCAEGLRKRRQEEQERLDKDLESKIRGLIVQRIEESILSNLAYICIRIPKYYPVNNQLKVLLELAIRFPNGVGTFKGDVGDAVFETLNFSSMTSGVERIYLIPQLDIPLATAQYNMPENH